MTKYCYLNGKIIPQDKASISLKDIGILRGYGVFEFLRTYNGKPFFSKEHFVRLRKSAKTLNLKISLSEKQLISVIKKLLLKNKFKEAGIRIILTGGETIDELGVKYNKNLPTFFILVDELNNLPKSFYQKGIKLITYEHQREISQIKTINYITAVKLQNLCKKKKAFDVLYTDKGFLLEVATSNFFIFKKNILLTPKDNILPGITRNLIIKLAKDKFKIKERNILLKELRLATEAFITSTTKGILPVVKIDDRNIGNGKVGKNTKYLMSLFHQYTKSH